ncbi:MAG: hypothetical protein GY799_26400 [Desulfobulbaceae bacterium]|nr:hypothetical protein [Desulfobulbaceae bacterium]
MSVYDWPLLSFSALLAAGGWRLAAGGIWYLKREVAGKTGRLQVEINERLLAEKAIKKSERFKVETGKIGKVGGWEFN